MATIKVFLPLPPKCLQPNERAHWARKAAAVKRSRGDAAIATIAAGSKDFDWKSPDVLPVFYFKTARAHDTDNLVAWLKSTLDGVADALRINDRQINLLLPIQEKDAADPRLELTISELEA